MRLSPAAKRSIVPSGLSAATSGLLDEFLGVVCLFIFGLLSLPVPEPQLPCYSDNSHQEHEKSERDAPVPVVHLSPLSSTSLLL
jgi:hypothetical protein